MLQLVEFVIHDVHNTSPWCDKIAYKIHCKRTTKLYSSEKVYVKNMNIYVYTYIYILHKNRFWKLSLLMYLIFRIAKYFLIQYKRKKNVSNFVSGEIASRVTVLVYSK